MYYKFKHLVPESDSIKKFIINTIYELGRASLKMWIDQMLFVINVVRLLIRYHSFKMLNRM